MTVGTTIWASCSLLYQLSAARSVFRSCLAVWSDTFTGGFLELGCRFLNCDVRHTAIGALSSAKLAFFDWETKQYRPIPVEEQVEVASLVGDIAVGPDGKPSVHVHAVLGRRDGTALAGHLQEGHVRPTLEIIITKSPAHLCKVKDAESGLALISARK